jgi:hypothetical protein
MSDSLAALIKKEYLNTHDGMFVHLQKMSDEQIHWRSSDETLSIAWHLWHVARWVDYFQARMLGMTPELSKHLASGIQVWDKEDYAKRWGFDQTDLGFAATGTGMAEDVAYHLQFPAKAELLGYLEKAFVESKRVVNAINDEQFAVVEQVQPSEDIWGDGTVGDVLFVHINHESRHFGMMECLLGLQGQPGSAFG